MAAHMHVDDEELSAYVDSELSPRRRRQVEAAIADCAVCQVSLDELTSLATGLREMPAESPPAGLMPRLPAREGRVTGGVGAPGRMWPPQGGAGAPGRRWSPRVPSARVAAGLALVAAAAGLGFYRLGGSLPGGGVASRPVVFGPSKALSGPFYNQNLQQAGGAAHSGATAAGKSSLGDLQVAPSSGDTAGRSTAGTTASTGLAAGSSGLTAAQDAPRIARTGRVDLQVKPADFDRTITTVNDIGSTLSGYVASSDVSEGGSRTAAISLRVPADRFQDALNQLRAVGSVTAYSVQGQDVTQQFVDNQARLASLKAQAAAMTRLLDRATSVSDIIAIQGQLAPLQTQVEQVQAQINYLNDSTTFATINMSISQVPKTGSSPWSGITDAFGRAGRGFMGTVEGAIVAIGTLAPILLLVGGFLLILFTRRRDVIPSVPSDT